MENVTTEIYLTPRKGSLPSSPRCYLPWKVFLLKDLFFLGQKQMKMLFFCFITLFFLKFICTFQTNDIYLQKIKNISLHPQGVTFPGKANCKHG